MMMIYIISYLRFWVSFHIRFICPKLRSSRHLSSYNSDFFKECHPHFTMTIQRAYLFHSTNKHTIEHSSAHTHKLLFSWILHEYFVDFSMQCKPEWNRVRNWGMTAWICTWDTRWRRRQGLISYYILVGPVLTWIWKANQLWNEK